jgi:hypothetical protein
MKKVCGAVLVECWSSDGKPREREVRCTMPPDHAGRHGWELDKGDAATRLHVDATLVAANRMAELQAENAALKRHYDAAAPEHNLLALLDLYEEQRDAARADVARLNKYSEAELDSLYAYARDRLDPDRPRELPVFVPGVRSVIDRRLADLEARVEQLENHPAGCSCTRCTG